MSGIVGALQKYICDKGKGSRALSVTNNDMNDSNLVEKEELEQKPGLTTREFPVLNHFCVPLEKFWVNGLLRDLLKIKGKLNVTIHCCHC